MSLFSCCPKKPKKSLDYVIKWVEDTDKTIKELDASIKELEDWKDTIDENISELVAEAIEDYDWSKLPEEALQAKADKVAEAIEGNLASLDENGNLVDSGKKPADFALVGHSHSAILDAGTESNISIDEGTISIVVEREGSGGETEINADNIGNLHRALMDPDGIPTQGSNNLITSGGVYNYKPSCIEDVVEERQYAKVYADNHDQEDPKIIIELNDSNSTENPVTKYATIGINNIDNLNRALERPDTTPISESDSLITSGAVNGAILGVNNVDPKTIVGNSSITINTTDNSVRGLSDFETRFPNQRFPYFITLGLYDGASTSYIDNAVLKYYKDGIDYKVSIYTAANVINITGTVTIVEEEETVTWGTAIFTNQADVDTVPTQNSPNLITSGAVYNAINAIPTQEVFNIKIVYVNGRYRLLFKSGVYSHGPIVLPSSKIVTVSNVLEYDHDNSALVEETFLGLFHYETQEGTYPIRIYIQVGGSCLSFSGDFYTLSDNRVAFIPGDGTAYTYEGSNYNYSDASGYIVTFPPQS